MMLGSCIWQQVCHTQVILLGLVIFHISIIFFILLQVSLLLEHLAFGILVHINISPLDSLEAFSISQKQDHCESLNKERCMYIYTGLHIP